MAADQYRNLLGAKVSEPKEEPDHGVAIVFIDLGNTKIELLHPLGKDSPIQNFLNKNPTGGMHHVCYEVDDIFAASNKLLNQGARILGDGKPKVGIPNDAIKLEK